MEADISIWRKTGHFYFALTRATRAAAPAPAQRLTCTKADMRCVNSREQWLLAQRAELTGLTKVLHLALRLLSFAFGFVFGILKMI
jgi:hypothetical protein